MINRVTLIGNVGKDPETRSISDTSCYSKFTLATSETYKDKSGQKVENTEWHNIIARNGLSNVVENYIKKGSQLYIEGRIKYRSYDDESGNKKYFTEIIADKIQMLGSKPKSEFDAS